MTFQLRILTDEHDDSASVDLERNKIYRAGNSFENDIFIQPPASQANEGEAFFDFEIQNNAIEFMHTTDNIMHKNDTAFTQNLVPVQEPVALPALFEFLGCHFVICDSSEPMDKWFKLLAATPQDVPVADDLEAPDMTEQETSHIEQMYAGRPKRMRLPPWLSPLQPAVDYLRKQGLIPYMDLAFYSKFSPKNKKIFILTLVFSFAVVMLLISFVEMQKYLAEHAVTSQQTNAIENMRSIRQIETNLPPRFNNLKFLSNKNDLVVVEGVVKDKEDIDYLMGQFARYKNNVQFKLLTADQAVRKLGDILKSQHADLITPHFNETTYRLYLTGLLGSLDAINEIELAVSNQLPEITDLETSQVYSLLDANKDLDELLARNNYAKRLTVKRNLDKRYVEVSGYLSSGEITDLKNSLSDFKNKYANLFNINIDVKDALLSLPFQISSVTTGGIPSFMTTDGKKVFVGGEIEGMKVESITATEISFSGKFPLTLKLDDALGSLGK